MLTFSHSHGFKKTMDDNPPQLLPPHRRRRRRPLPVLEPPAIKSASLIASITRAKGNNNTSRIVIPLPPIMASISAITTGRLVPTTDVPSILIDREWFFLDSYPRDLRSYLQKSGFTFQNSSSRSAEELMKNTQEFLRQAYLQRLKVGLNIPISQSYKEIFDELTKYDTAGTTPAHRFEESEETRSLYLILAFVMCVLLWRAAATQPLREYPEATYPGVLVSSYVARLEAYFLDISALPKILNKGDSYNPISTTPKTLDDIPRLTVAMRQVAELAYGKISLTPDICDDVKDGALKEAALNSQNPAVAAPTSIYPPGGGGDMARCEAYLGVIERTAP